ncbi:Uncharacterised protein [Sphingobacterium spiritivorum]|uniref:Lipoprotein n=1 Tax=Sphingobacterium spiritivorum TaxID=258 RepID=A0A380BTA1_SPHSI|nr:hypothetical protein [Sphingobacterium spiritivorum]SUJ06177.1 Uncharacterised protein [Sphingobacterium spiritivorum]
MLKKSIKFTLIIVAASLTLGCQQTQKTTDNTTTDSSAKDSIVTTTKEDVITFGFLDSLGKHILTLEQDSLPHPEQYDLVLNDQGKGFPVQYKGFQKSTDGDNGRQTADNFDKSAGFLYQLKENKLTSSATAVVLTDNAFLSSRKVLIPHAAKDAGTMPAAVQKLVAEKNRKVKNFKNIAQIDEKTLISIVEFEVKNDSALAVLVYSSPQKTITQEYKAKYDDMSTWRVDDGGDFNMDYIDILYAFIYRDNIELVLSDMGAEGYNVTYLKEKAGAFVVAKEAYGYSAPF